MKLCILMVWTLNVIINLLIFWFHVHAFFSKQFWPVFDGRFLSMVFGARKLNFLMVKVLDYTYIISIGFRQFCSSIPDCPFSLYSIIIPVIIIFVIIIFIIIIIIHYYYYDYYQDWILVNNFRPLGFIIRNSILDLAGLMDLPLFNIIIL